MIHYFFVLAFSCPPSKLADNPAGGEGPGAGKIVLMTAGGRGFGEFAWGQSVFNLHLTMFSLSLKSLRGLNRKEVKET